MLKTLATQSEHHLLDDGAAITIRAIRPDDVPRLQAFHARLSPETIYGRYLGVHPTLSPSEAGRLAASKFEHVAFVATRAEQGDEAIVGVAHYDRLGPGHADQAEAAVVVEDRYQGCGIGKRLLQRLVDHAREHGVNTLVAEVCAANDRLLGFIGRSGLPMRRKLQAGVWEIRVQLR
jgi:GNAT superfamily N-acetyltransferase